MAENEHHCCHQKWMLWRNEPSTVLSYCCEKYQQSTDLSIFTSKRDAVDLQEWLLIAVKENNNDQLIFFHIKKGLSQGYYMFFFEYYNCSKRNYLTFIVVK